MSNPSKAKGTAAETAVVRHLRTQGWPLAERRALHGSTDLGDVTGLPGLCVEVKGGKAAETSTPLDLATWKAQTLAETRNAGAAVGLLVTKRKGSGATRVGDWHAHLYLPQIARLTGPDVYVIPPPVWVRLSLDEALAVLRALGYGSPLQRPNTTTQPQENQ